MPLDLQKSLLEPPTEEKESLSDFEKHLLELKAELKAPPKKKNARTYKGIDSEQSMNIKSLMGIPVVMPQGEKNTITKIIEYSSFYSL